VTLSEEAAADGLGYVETMERGKPSVVEVYDGPAPMLRPGGPLLVRLAARPGEHPADLVRRALIDARRERIRRANTA
jgi:hypothetical protein